MNDCRQPAAFLTHTSSCASSRPLATASRLAVHHLPYSHRDSFRAGTSHASPFKAPSPRLSTLYKVHNSQSTICALPFDLAITCARCPLPPTPLGHRRDSVSSLQPLPQWLRRARKHAPSFPHQVMDMTSQFCSRGRLLLVKWCQKEEWPTSTTSCSLRPFSQRANSLMRCCRGTGRGHTLFLGGGAGSSQGSLWFLGRKAEGGRRMLSSADFVSQAAPAPDAAKLRSGIGCRGVQGVLRKTHIALQ